VNDAFAVLVEADLQLRGEVFAGSNDGSPAAPISWKPSGAAMLVATLALSAWSAWPAVSAASALCAVFAEGTV
jgi:hypothetical protein